LYAQGNLKFREDSLGVTTKGITLCQPLLMDHMYVCTKRTMTDLKEFCANNRADLQRDISSNDHFAIHRAEADAIKYQNSILAQLKEIQAVCSHTAQTFLATLIPGSKAETSPLFISLKNRRQIHYEKQALKPLEQRVPYTMHHILRYIETNTVRDDAMIQHVIEHDMLLHTRPAGMNIYSWLLSFYRNLRRHRHVTGRHMHPKERHMFHFQMLVDQLTTNELDTISTISPTDFPYLIEGIYDMSALQKLLA
jgi:hypothetical protein